MIRCLKHLLIFCFAIRCRYSMNWHISNCSLRWMIKSYYNYLLTIKTSLRKSSPAKLSLNFVLIKYSICATWFSSLMLIETLSTTMRVQWLIFITPYLIILTKPSRQLSKYVRNRSYALHMDMTMQKMIYDLTYNKILQMSTGINTRFRVNH